MFQETHQRPKCRGTEGCCFFNSPRICPSVEYPGLQSVKSPAHHRRHPATHIQSSRRSRWPSSAVPISNGHWSGHACLKLAHHTRINKQFVTDRPYISVRRSDLAARSRTRGGGAIEVHLGKSCLVLAFYRACQGEIKRSDVCTMHGNAGPTGSPPRCTPHETSVTPSPPAPHPFGGTRLSRRS